MGYDCTLHVVDEKHINETFVKALLDGKKPETLDDELWAEALKSLAEDPAESACSSICQLALIYASGIQPYHYERGFALCLWPDQPDGLDAKFPAKFADSPEVLFRELVNRFPKLKGSFPIEFSGNWSTGIFVPSEKVSAALKWVEARVLDYEEGNRELFRGLLLVLQHCAKHNLAYWEGTDLPIPQATMEAEGAGARRAARSFKWPDPGFEPLACHGSVFVCKASLPREVAGTAVVDFSTWPPTLNLVDEYALSACFTDTGKLVTVARGVNQSSYTVRVRASPTVDAEVQELSGDKSILGENGYEQAVLYREQVVAQRWFQKGKTPKRYPQFQQGAELLDNKTFSAPRDNHKDHYGREYVRFGVARTSDGSEIFIWGDGGYEPRNNQGTEDPKPPRWTQRALCRVSQTLWPRLAGESTADEFQKTFSLGDDRSFDNWTSVAAGSDGFYYLRNRGLYEIHRGAAVFRHLPKLTNIMQLKSGPENSLLLKEGDNKAGDWGKLYWPDSRQITRLKPALAPEVPCGDLRALHWLESQKRLLVFSDKEVWFVTWEEIQQLPRTKVRE